MTEEVENHKKLTEEQVADQARATINAGEALKSHYKARASEFLEKGDLVRATMYLKLADQVGMAKTVFAKMPY